MPVSRPCEECSAVRRCRLFLDRDGVAVYLCAPCARGLGFSAPGAKRLDDRLAEGFALLRAGEEE